MDTIPLTISINEACNLSGLSRSFLYIRILDKTIASTKAGKRRLVNRISLLKFLNVNDATTRESEVHHG